MERIEFIIIIVIIIAFAVMMIQISPIFAQEISRDHIRNTTKSIDEINEEYGFVDSLIVQQRELVTKYTEELRINEEKLETTKSKVRSDWGAIQSVAEDEVNVELSREKLEEAQERLQAVLNEKEQLYNQRESLKVTLDEYNDQWREQSQPDLTGTVKLLGVKLSQSCILMLKNNITSNCPSYEELEQLDTSNTEYSGEFGWKDGYYQRLDSPFKNGYEIYKYDPTIRLLVDPPSNHQSRIKMITIENNFGTFIEAPTDNKLHNNTITLHEKRDVKGCRTAQISTDGWQELLPDTIYYLRTDCQVTNFDNQVTTVREDTYWNPEDSAGWHYRNWLESVRFLCLGLC